MTKDTFEIPQELCGAAQGVILMARIAIPWWARPRRLQKALNDYEHAYARFRGYPPAPYNRWGRVPRSKRPEWEAAIDRWFAENRGERRD